VKKKGKSAALDSSTRDTRKKKKGERRRGKRKLRKRCPPLILYLCIGEKGKKGYREGEKEMNKAIVLSTI